MTELGPILARLGIDQYLDAFIGEGFDTWETVLDITESDLDTLNVKLGHRRKLQREIANYRGVSYDRSLESPAHEAASDSSKAGESEATFSLGQAPEKKPSGGHEGKRKYRRHPKPDGNAPDRPPSAYVIFSNKVREDVKGQSLAFTEIAKLVGENWQLLTPSQKEPFEAQAAAERERYITELAEYKKTDSYKEYVQYLADFKAKHGVTTEGKRPKLGRDTRNLAGGGWVKQSESSDPIPTIQPHSRRVSMSSASHAGSLPSPSSAVLPFLGHASTHTMTGHGQRTSPSTESPPPFMPPRSGMFNAPVPFRPSQPHSPNPKSQARSGPPPDSAFMDTKDTTGYQGYVSSPGVESPANTRHTSRMPAPLLHQDTTVSRSSLSSGLSSGSTSSISGIPRTSNDEPWVQRPGLIQGIIPAVDSIKGGSDYLRSFHPPLTNPFSPNYPTLPLPRPTDRVPESTSPIAEYQRVDTYLRSLPPPTTGPPSSFSPSKPARHLLLRSNVSDAGTGQSATASSTESQPPNLPSASLSDRGDPLAVLAYAGRLLDEER